MNNIGDYIMKQEDSLSNHSVGPVFATGVNGETLQINPNNGASMVVAAAPLETAKPQV
jgi:hypothetical protein